MSVDGHTIAANAPARRRLWWLIAARCALALLLLPLSYWWLHDAPGARGGALVIAGAVLLLLSGCYALVLRFTRWPLQGQAGAQFFLDALLVTWLVGARGDIHSPYVVLYIVIIASACAFLGVRGALVTSVGCALLYTLAMMSKAFGWLAAPGAVDDSLHGEALAEVVGSVALYDAAFFIVGLLAARLAERQSRSDVRLIEATHALTNLRALHERIVESIRSGVVTTDLDGRIYTFNSAAEELTGYTADDLRGEDISILFGDFADKIAGSLRAAEEGRPSPRLEADCLTADGLRLRLGYTISPLSNERGERSGLVVTFLDLTQVRALEETSRRQDRLAAVGRVAAGIAHEIRNPLAAMRGSIQVLRSEVDGDSGEAELMEIILRESDRLNRIITDFLTYARPRPVALAEADVREPLRETFTLLRHSAETRSDHIIEEDYPAEPLRALIDVAGLKQVCWNLARNALIAMPEGGRLRVALMPLERERLRITFADDGTGMTPEQVEHLFEPFSSSTNGGTGLGLSIVYQIVRDHGGTINVRSLEGHGTTITVELPGGATADASDRVEHESAQGLRA